MPPLLLLASTSPARRALLDGLGVPYRAEAPGVDEEVPAGTRPELAVQLLAERKARAVSARHPGAWVLGADQLAVCGDHVLGKPADRDAARQQLELLAGREHRLVTGVCLIADGGCALRADVARLQLYPLSNEELERYLDLEEWRGCAGGYRIEAAGQALISRLDGDRTSVQGLPMGLVVALLREAGLSFFHRPRA